MRFHAARLNSGTARLSEGAEVVFAFVHADLGVRMIALRLAGFNPVDLAAACDAGIAMARVPAYSPHAVAEPTVALIPALNRKTHRACKMRLEN